MPDVYAAITRSGSLTFLVGCSELDVVRVAGPPSDCLDRGVNRLRSGNWRRVNDLALGLLRHGYAAVARDRAGRGAGDDYPTRLLGRRALVVRSHDGVRTFYDEAIVRRKGAIPPPLAWLLFGR